MNNKKNLLLMGILLVSILGILTLFFSNPFDLKETGPIHSTSTTTMEQLNHNFQTITITTKEIEPQNQMSEQNQSSKELQDKGQTEKQEPSTLEFLQLFGKKWLNYDSIVSRNQSVLSFFSEEVIEKYALNVDPKVELKASGKITQISQSLINDREYFLIGEEKVRGNQNKILIELQLTEDTEPKIKEFMINYVRQAD